MVVSVSDVSTETNMYKCKIALKHWTEPSNVPKYYQTFDSPFSVRSNGRILVASCWKTERWNKFRNRATWFYVFLVLYDKKAGFVWAFGRANGSPHFGGTWIKSSFILAIPLTSQIYRKNEQHTPNILE